MGITMFAPKVAKTPTKSADNLRSSHAPQQSTLAGRRPGHDPVEQALLLQRTIGNQAMLRLFARQTSEPIVSNPPRHHEQGVGVTENAMGRGTSRGAWDSSKIPVIPPDRPRATAPFVPPQAPDFLRAKLAVGRADDRYEQEADRIADLVTGATYTHQGAPVPIQPYSGRPRNHMDVAPASVNEALTNPGRPLEPTLRFDMESRLGYDLSRVRIHSDSDAARSAQEINANAYTVGNNVVFGANRFMPHTRAGQRLLAHELTHVVQQQNASESPMGAVQRDDGRGKSGDSDDRPVDFEIFVADPKHQKDVGFARKIGKADAKNIRAAGSLSREIKLDVVAKRRFFQPPAREAYDREVGPALIEVTREEIDMSEAAEATRKRDAIIAKGRTGIYTDISTLLDLIQKLKESRLQTWKKNEDVAAAKPSFPALEVAIAIVSEGFGGIAYGLIEHAMGSHAGAERDDPKLHLFTEFVSLAGLEAADLASEHAFHKALDEAKETLAQANKIALESQGKESVRRALTSNPDNGLLECYIEAVRLQSIAEQKEDEQQFTTRAAKASDTDLADQWAIYNAIYTELMASPDAFMRQLTVGFIRLMDEVRLEKRAEKAGGDRGRQRREDAEGAYNEFRRGNLFISFGWPNGPGDLGDWSHPNLKLDPHAETSGIHTVTANAIAGARIKDLPLSMTFSFWAIDKSLPHQYANKVKVEFDRDPEGNIYVGLGAEWLAKYSLGADRQLTEREQRLNAWYGARKLYHELRFKRIVSVKGLSYL
jgi:hypothetical protein